MPPPPLNAPGDPPTPDPSADYERDPSPESPVVPPGQQLSTMMDDRPHTHSRRTVPPQRSHTVGATASATDPASSSSREDRPWRISAKNNRPPKRGRGHSPTPARHPPYGYAPTAADPPVPAAGGPPPAKASRQEQPRNVLEYAQSFPRSFTPGAGAPGTQAQVTSLPDPTSAQHWEPDLPTWAAGLTSEAPVGEHAHIAGATTGGQVPHLIPLSRRIVNWAAFTDITVANPMGSHKYLRTIYVAGIKLEFLYADFMQWVTDTAYQRNWVLISASGNSDPLNPGKGWFAHLIFGAERMAHEAIFHLHKNCDHRAHAVTNEGFRCVLCKEATNLIKQQQHRERRRRAGAR